MAAFGLYIVDDQMRVRARVEIRGKIRTGPFWSSIDRSQALRLGLESAFVAGSGLHYITRVRAGGDYYLRLPHSSFYSRVGQIAIFRHCQP